MADTTMDIRSAEQAPLVGRAHAGLRVRAHILEFLLVGGITVLLFPLSWLCQRAFGLDTSEWAIDFLMYHAAFVINDPHFAVTYVLFYKDAKNRALGTAFTPAQRLRYLIAGVVVPLLLATWAAVALATKSAATMGWMIQLMFFLVGWHYVKQGFGVLIVLSARRGVYFRPLERIVILAHCFLGWAYAWASPADPGRTVSEKGVIYRSLAHPVGLERLTQAAFFLSALAVIAVLVKKWRTDGRLPPLAPLSGLLITVWLWTVYSWVDPLMLYMIPALHSVQYLYFVWLLKRNEARAHEGPPSFGLPTRVRLGILAVSAVGLGLLLFHGAPTFLDSIFPSHSTDRLGPTPFFAALFALVNIHHYFMDHVIWRRDNPDTRYMFADPQPRQPLLESISS